MPQIIKIQLNSGTPFDPLASMQRNMSANKLAKALSLKTKPKNPAKADLAAVFAQLEGWVLSLVPLHSSSSTGYLQLGKKKKKSDISFHRLLFAPF